MVTLVDVVNSIRLGRASEEEDKEGVSIIWYTYLVG